MHGFILETMGSFAWTVVDFNTHFHDTFQVACKFQSNAPVVDGGADDGQLRLDGGDELPLQLGRQMRCAHVVCAGIGGNAAEEGHLVGTRRLRSTHHDRRTEAKPTLLEVGALQC